MWHLAYFVPIDGHFGKIGRYARIYINFYMQTNFEVNQTQIGSKNHYNGHISKPHFAQVSFTKKPTPPTFSMNLSGSFRINVNMDFSLTNRGRFLI